MGGGLIFTQTRTPAAPPALVASTSSLKTTAPLVLPALTPEIGKPDDLVAPPPKPLVVAKPKPPARAVHVSAPVYDTPPRPIAAPAPGFAITSGGTAAAGSPPVTITENNVPVVVHQSVARPVCVNCGTIESVTPVERQGKGGGVGAVAGGVLGAVVGNQVGHGGGRTAATLLGALGGGFAGNAVEKHVNRETVYQVRIRMEDGSTRTVEQGTQPSVGTRVTVDNGVMHAAYNN
ncbi:MAG: glycine zipper 2TM domain-containing protein [Rhodoferax sp.]|nr:glycine zipper 2TM domain-containing protein [Rhodoferax sp.]